MTRVLAFLSLLLALAWLPPAHAGSEGPKLYLLHDVPDDGYTYVGNVNHFGYVLQDADGSLSVHHNGVLEVSQNGVVLYRTTPDSGHDYDVLNTLQVAFPVAGPYEVKGTVPLSGSVNAEAVFHGNVSGEAPNMTAKIEVESKGAVVDGTPVEFTVRLTDAATGALIPHSDAIVEVRRPDDQWLVFRTHLHTHEEAMTFQYLFPNAGDYLVRAVGYMAFPDAAAPRFAPVAATRTVSVSSGTLESGNAGIPAKPTAMASGRYELQTSIDPQDSNTPFSRTVVSGLVFDREADAYVPHVNFEAWIDEPAGHTIFHSKSLHEYDGDYDVVLNLPYPSKYTLTLQATRGDWTGVVTKDFTIAEVVTGSPLVTSAGGVVVTAKGLDGLKSGSPSSLTFQSRTLAGTAAQHSEIDFEILRAAWGPPLLQNKIHTHATGDFQVDVTFPEAGDYLLVVDPVNIHGEPDAQYYFGEVGGPLVVPLKVAPGVPLVAMPASAPPPAAAPLELPAPPAFLVLAALAGLVLWRRHA
jgi:hypothetical protein